MEWVGRDGAWDFPAHPLPSLSPCGFTYPTPTLFPWPSFPGLSTPFSIVWPATYSCTGPHWWSRQSQCLCFLDSGCRSSDGSRADRSPWHSGYSDGCWCCSSDRGSIGLQARGKDRSLDGRQVGIQGHGMSRMHSLWRSRRLKTPKSLPGTLSCQNFLVMPEFKPREERT